MCKWFFRLLVWSMWAYVAYKGFLAYQHGHLGSYLFGAFCYLAAYIVALFAFDWIRSIIAVRVWVRKYPHLVYLGLIQLETDTTGQYGSNLRKRVLKYAMTH